MSRSKTPPIAVVGVSALFPGSTDAGGFWKDILEGTDRVTEVPASHWLIEDYYDPDPKAVDKTYCKRGAFLSEVPFDCMGFGTPPDLVQQTDTTQLLALVVARKVLEDAAQGAFEHVDKSRMSVILGATGATELVVHLGSRLQRPIWLKSLRESGIPEDEAQKICDRIANSYVPWTEASFPGLLGNVVAGRIANRFNLGGTNCVVDAACASSQSAIAMALSELYLGQSDTVITGGVDTLNDILMYMCFSKTPALSASGDCRPFSDGADGTILGEGLGMMALRRLEDAERDGDRIYGVIKGIGTSSDGKGTSVYAPNAKGQAVALRRAYENAEHGPETVELIEAHGTGTKAGDKAEFQGLRTVFSETNREDHQWCALGSVKSQIGHTKGAAGAASMFKAVMALHHKVLPPTIKVSKPNPGLEIETSPFYLNTKARPWIRSSDFPRRASVSSFGFGGSNFHIVMEEYTGPGVRKDLFRPAPTELVLLSADQVEDLIALCGKTAAAKEGLTPLAKATQLAFQASHQARLAVVAKDMADLGKKLAAAAEALAKDGKANQQKPGWYYAFGKQEGKLAFLFPGQGSHYLGMGAELAMAFDECREVWDRLADTPFDGTPLHQVAFPPTAFDKETEKLQNERLTQTQWAQPAIGAVSASQMALLNTLGLKPDCTAGHSFGEVAALFGAGAFDEVTMLRLARKRGELMAGAARNGAGAMTVVLHQVDKVKALLESEAPDVVFANHNSPGQVVLSGATQALEDAEKILKAAKVRYKRLPVAAAFHSPIVSGAATPFAEFLKEQDVTAPQVPVYANGHAAPYATQPDHIRSVLGGQLAEPVRFAEMVGAMHADGVRTFIEVGPGNVLTALVKENLRDKPFTAINLDSRKQHDLTAWQHGLGQICVQGFKLDLQKLWAPLADVSPAPASKLAVPVKGVNFKKPYPPEQGAAGLPKPNPPRPVQAETVQPAPQKKEVVDTMQKPAPNQPMPAPTATAPTPAVMAQPAQVAPAQPAPAAAHSRPNGESSQWLATFQELQQQTSVAHMAFLQMSERSMTALENMSRDRWGSTQPVVSPAPVQMAAPQPVAAPQPPTPAPMPVAAQPAPVASAPVVAPAPVTPPAPVAAAPTPAAAPALDLNALMLEIVAEKTGYPAEMLELEMNLEADLGIDSIKRVEILSAMQERVPDLPAVDPQDLAALTTLGQIAGYMADQAGVVATPAGPEPALQAPSLDLNGLMLEIVAEKTGYPAEMLELEMNLEADLGIDSIKRVEILSAMQERVPDLPAVDPQDLAALTTLGQIAGYMADQAGVSAAPESAPAAQAAPAIDLNALMLEIVAEKTGYPAEMLELEMNLEADLGIDSIKRVEILSAMQERVPDLPSVDPQDLAALSTLGQIAGYMAEQAGINNAPTNEPIAQDAAPAAPALDLNVLMLEIVAEKTGYPAEMLELEMNLEADLGIDSIKRVEILSAMQERVPDLPSVDPQDLAALSTLGQIAGYMANQAGMANPAASVAPVSAVAETSEVGRYIVDVVERDAPGLAAPFLFEGHTAYITDEGSGIASRLATELRGHGIKSEVTSAVPADARVVISLDGLGAVANADEALAVNGEVFKLATRVAPSFEKEGGLLIAVQDTGGSFGFEPIPQYREWLGGLTGLVKTAAQEWPKACVRGIDLQRENRSINELVSGLADEIMSGGRDLEIGLTADGRRLTPVPVLAQLEQADRPYAGEPVMIVSGGARGVTAASVIALATRQPGRFALLGRTPLGEEPICCVGIGDSAALKKALLTDAMARGEKPTPRELGAMVSRIESMREIRQTLSDLHATGSQAQYISCDINNQASVVATLAEVREQWGPITGLVHGAGVLADKMLSEKTEEHFNKVFGTKVGGLRLLLDALAEDPLDRVCLFSSVAARYGNAGQSDYAMANEVLNRVATALASQRPDCLVKSINWGPWESGMVTPALKAKFKAMGVPLIPLDHGAQVFANELSDVKGRHREIVVGGPPQNKALINPHGLGEFQLDAIVGAGTHPYLTDHSIDGVVVVPVVLVLEWFLGAARSVRPSQAIAAVKNLQVFKGIRLPEFETDLSRFRVRVVETENDLQMTLLDTNGVPRYGASVEMDIARPAFSGEVPAMKLDPVNLSGSAIYGEKLFHGPNFAAIRAIEAMGEGGAEATLIGTRFLDWPKVSWEMDPALLDGGLQMALIWAFDRLGKRSLPTSFSEFRLYQPDFTEPVRCVLRGELNGDTGSRSDLWFIDSQGRLLAEMRGLNMFVIDPAGKPSSDPAVIS